MNRGRKNWRQDSLGISLIEVVLALGLFSAIAAMIFSTEWMINDIFLHNSRVIVSSHAANQNLLHIFSDGSAAISAHLSGRFGDVEPLAFGVSNFLLPKPFTVCEQIIESAAVWKGVGNISTSSTTFLEADLRSAAALGLDCGGHPAQFADDQFQNIETLSLGTLATSVDFIDNYGLISFRPTVAQGSTPSLALFARSEPGVMSYGYTGFGINKIDAIDGFAFAAQQSSTTQLAIIDISEQQNPLLIATSSLPNVAGSRPEAVSIFYYDNKVYVGTKRTAGHEFHIFDVTNRSSPRWLGSREVNHNINDIEVRDGFAFLATSGNVRDLIVLDVHDPTHIFQKVELDLPGNEDGRSLLVVGNHIFLGRYKGTAPGHNELYDLFFTIDTTEEGENFEFRIVSSQPTGADITDLTLSGGSIFAATTHPQKELQIFGFDQFGHLMPVAVRNMASTASGVDFENETVVVTAGADMYVYAQE